MTEKQREAFRKRIKKLMIDFELTNRGLAEQIGWSESMLLHAVNGTKAIPFDMVIALSKRFNMTIDSLIAEEN
ncbi:MAG: helix-turn-helix transcriptional regulator [Clostridia bacterium]|nr:helix-turn-helix transcriptional regulator [Clostridia bacterium]